MAVISTFSVDIKIAVIIGDFMLYLIPLWKRIEVVITSRTRNAVVLFGHVGSNPTVSVTDALLYGRAVFYTTRGK